MTIIISYAIQMADTNKFSYFSAVVHTTQKYVKNHLKIFHSNNPRNFLYSTTVLFSQYSVWLRPRRPGDRGSIPGRGKRYSSPATRHGGAWWERRYSSYSFTTSALDGGESPATAKGFFFSSLCVQTGAGAHPASCTMSTGGPFHGGKSEAGA
jgi:hypothetical protein